MSASELVAAVPNQFDKAVNSGDLFLFPSTISTHQEFNVPFEIRLCPALQKKPTLPTLSLESPKKGADAEQKKPDPFSPPYVPNLYIGELSDALSPQGHVLLLNKFSLVEHHFLLVSKDYQSQGSPLLPHDLVRAFEILQAARKMDRHYLAFYNCGDLSGASQPHKHVQFIPVESDGPPIERLAKAATLQKPNTPFALMLSYANHVYRFPPDIATRTREQLEEVLTTAFLALLDLTISTIRHDPDYPSNRPSYNVLLTHEHMHIIPRGKETFHLSQTGDEVSVNALGYAGILLVKSEQELEAVKNESVAKILRDVGLESIHDAQVAGTSDQ